MESTEKQTRECEESTGRCHSPETSKDVPLFERPWDEFVVKRGEDGKYRSFTQCCGCLTPE
jgi:hypothetical protein